MDAGPASCNLVPPLMLAAPSEIRGFDGQFSILWRGIGAESLTYGYESWRSWACRGETDVRAGFAVASGTGLQFRGRTGHPPPACVLVHPDSGRSGGPARKRVDIPGHASPHASSRVHRCQFGLPKQSL